MKEWNCKINIYTDGSFQSGHILDIKQLPGK